MDDDIGSIREAIGSMTARLSSIEQWQRDRRTETRELNEQLRADIQRMAISAETSYRDVAMRLQAIESKQAEQKVQTDQIAADVATMRGPVAQFVSMRKSVARVSLFILSIASLLWVIAQPVYTFFTTRVLAAMTNLK